MPTCSSCHRERTIHDAYDYSPLQVVTNQPLGWYSGDDGEMCPECMTKTMRRREEKRREEMSDNVIPLPRKQTRLNININQQTEAALRRYSTDHGVTITEALRRFAGVAEMVMQAVDHGGEIWIRKDGETERIVFTY